MIGSQSFLLFFAPEAFAGHLHPFHLAVLFVIEAVDAE